MALQLLNSKYGKIHRFTKNPRFISDGAFTTLVESIDRDFKFLRVRSIVVWEVPDDIATTHPKSPFCGQHGKLIVIGGNQRYCALLQLHYDRIPDDAIVLAQDADGKWWSPDEAERFLLMDNNPEGISGETDYQELVDKFNAEAMKLVGIDFAQAPLDFQEEQGKPVEEEVEEGEHGEKEKGMEDFIKDREASRAVVPGMLDSGYYSILEFDTTEDMLKFAEFIGNKFSVRQNGQYIDGYAFAKALGCEIEPPDIHFRDPKPEKALQGLAMSGIKEGWEVEGSGVEEGTETADDEGKDELGDTFGGI